MYNIKKLKLKELSEVTDKIGLVYLKANSFIRIGKDDLETVSFTFKEITTSYKVTPTQMVEFINNALYSLDEVYQRIIASEILHINKEDPFWYLDCYSRSTYFRYRKIAYYKFVSLIIWF